MLEHRRSPTVPERTLGVPGRVSRQLAERSELRRPVRRQPAPRRDRGLSARQPHAPDRELTSRLRRRQSCDCEDGCGRRYRCPRGLRARPVTAAADCHFLLESPSDLGDGGLRLGLVRAATGRAGHRGSRIRDGRVVARGRAGSSPSPSTDTGGTARRSSTLSIRWQSGYSAGHSAGTTSSPASSFRWPAARAFVLLYVARAARCRRRSPRGALPRAVSDVAVPAGRVQRIALPRLLPCRLRARGATALASSRNRDGSGDPDARRRPCTAPGDPPAGVALARTSACNVEHGRGARTCRALPALAPVAAPCPVRRSQARAAGTATSPPPDRSAALHSLKPPAGIEQLATGDRTHAFWTHSGSDPCTWRRTASRTSPSSPCSSGSASRRATLRRDLFVLGSLAIPLSVPHLGYPLLDAALLPHPLPGLPSTGGRRDHRPTGRAIRWSADARRRNRPVVAGLWVSSSWLAGARSSSSSARR